MRIAAKSLLTLVLLLSTTVATAAEEVTNISLIQMSTGREMSLQHKRPIGLTNAKPGDQLVLSTDSRHDYVFSISESKISLLGNTILRGETVSGGRVLLVIDKEARIKGHFQGRGGMVQLTTDEFGTITAWREGIDTVSVPFTCEVEGPRDSNRPTHEQLQSYKSAKRTPGQASKFTVEEAEPEVRFARYASGHATVRILIYYDSTMTDYVERLADFLVEITNDALVDSAVSLSLEIAGLLPIEWDAATSTEDAFPLMYDQVAPYENIVSDQQAYSASLVATLVGEDRPEGDAWGRGMLGGQFSAGRYSITRSWDYEPGEEFYSDYSFAHEIGHNLGLNHNREEYTQEETEGNYTFSYAYGFYEADVHKTIMSYNTFGYVPRIPFFSNPNLTKDGFTLGRSFLDSDSADASRALFNNRHPAQSMRGGTEHSSELAREQLSFYESECGEELEEGEEKGRARLHSLSTPSNSQVHINSSHKIRADGSSYVYRYPAGSTYGSHYDCRLPDEGLSDLGTEYVESFFRYTDPADGRLVESAHVMWEEDMEGDYSHVRVAFTDGGKAVGNTSLLLKEGSEHTIKFDADYGFKVTDIESSCDGRRDGSSFIVSVTSDDCRVEATFGEGNSTTLAQQKFGGLMGTIQGLGQPAPEPSSKDPFVGTYHIFRPQAPGREDIIRIGEDQSLAFDSNSSWYRWERNGANLDVFYMYKSDDPGGDYRFSISQDPSSGRIEITDSYYTSVFWDFYGEQKSTDSEADFDLYELGRDYWGEEQHVLRCFNKGRREFSFYSTSWYSDSQLPSTSTDLEECRSFCPAILQDYQERDPENWSDRVCEGDEESSAASTPQYFN